MRHRAGIALVILAVLVVAGIVAIGGGTAVDSITEIANLEKHRIVWTSGVAGATFSTRPIRGRIERVVIVPGTSASQPTTAYDMTLLDEDSVDMLAGNGANLSSNVTSSFVPGEALTDGVTTSVIPFTVDGVLDLAVTNAGGTNSGTIILYVRP